MFQCFLGGGVAFPIKSIFLVAIKESLRNTALESNKFSTGKQSTS